MMPEGAAFQEWIRQLDGFEGATVAEIALAEGGASNITCRVRVSNAKCEAVGLRIEREHGIFEPYDVVREGEVLRRLEGSPVPAPRLFGSEADSEWLGAPFIVMEWIDAPHMGLAADAHYGAFVGMVAQIHQLDWESRGLEFLGRPETARAALLGELQVIEARRRRFAGADEPILADGMELLAATAPSDGRIALCQGDINVFNYLSRGGEIVGVVDWEQARLSDPRSDAGQLLALSVLKGAPWGEADAQPFVQAYAAVGGETLRGMAWFRARWLWELGVIYHGWRAYSGSDPWYSHEAVTTALAQALDELGHG